MKYPFLTSKAVSLTRRKIFLFSLYTLFAYTLTGCGKEDELENYKANMNQFFENVRVFDASINAIENPESDQAVSELLTLLDSMDTSFQQMAALEVPDCFPGVEELADDASMYMSEAVSYYHMAYEGGGFDASLEDVTMPLPTQGFSISFPFYTATFRRKFSLMRTKKRPMNNLQAVL